MIRRIRSECVVLIGQMLAVGAFLYFTGRLKPVTVPDTHLYTDFPWDSLSSVLGNIRVPGYPAFLELVTFSGRLALVPAAHYVAFCVAVFVFSSGLKRLGFSAWGRMWTASALLYADILQHYLATIASDTLAAALVVASVGLLFSSLANRWFLIPLALCVMATWLVRPAYLSLTVQIPLLGAALEMSRRRERLSPQAIGRTLGLLAVIMVVPLLAWCTLRSVVVGRFCVVASGGFNVIGIAGQFLDEQLVPTLSPDLQPLAKMALSRHSMEDCTAPVLMCNESVLNYQRIENRYDHTIWNLFYPAAEQTASKDVSTINNRLRRLAQEIIRARPVMYAIYLAKAFRRAVFRIVGNSVLNPYNLALCLLILAVTVVRVLSGPPAGGGHFSGLKVAFGASEPGIYDLCSVMLLTALSYAACLMAVVILVCPPLVRMTDAMSLFIPSLLMAVLLRGLPRRVEAEVLSVPTDK